ncbi:hypothetical protein PAXRUDRAFT_17726 [Paxillus rubicundulus Ve08.2h10]|uniref:Uncharacterized protein n=1 Tax=Paxillus rubicundulus Ve08.2h10 TaxID=930991 RepID=A0A0D0D9H2_9AGAM|nr:hypothetical protein PAXRUDRAFT_17726 [Paxillus rubicundulus Ve08.2h10]
MPARPVLGNIMGGATDHDSDLPQELSFHAEHPHVQMLLPASYTHDRSHTTEQFYNPVQPPQAVPGPSTRWFTHDQTSGEVMGEVMLWEAPQEPPPSMISSDQCMETNVGYDQEEAALWQGTDESSQQYFTTGAWTSGIHTLRIPVRKSTQASHGAPPECRVSISATQKLDGVGAHLCAGADEVQPDQPGPVPPPAAPYHRLSMLLHFIRFGVEKHERHKTAAPT